MPKIFKFSLFLVISILASHASASTMEDNQCWQSEINPSTKAIYESESAWQDHVQKWEDMNVPQAGAVQLAMAYAIYKSEKEKSLSLGNDKVAHCYIGCRVAKKISVRTTRYMGWYKEMQDITDCRKATHFEGRDYIATVSGAKAPGSSSDACVKYCQSTWGTP